MLSCKILPATGTVDPGVGMTDSLRDRAESPRSLPPCWRPAVPAVAAALVVLSLAGAAAVGVVGGGSEGPGGPSTELVASVEVSESVVERASSPRQHRSHRTVDRTVAGSSGGDRNVEPPRPPDDEPGTDGFDGGARWDAGNAQCCGAADSPGSVRSPGPVSASPPGAGPDVSGAGVEVDLDGEPPAVAPLPPDPPVDGPPPPPPPQVGPPPDSPRTPEPVPEPPPWARAPDVVGQPPQDAAQLLTLAGFTIRVVERDGERFRVTQDWVPTRANLVIADGVVTAVSFG